MKALVINCSPVRDGATAEVGKIVSRCLGDRYEVRSICIDDFKFSFCRGCRTCHRTAKCVQHDDVDKIMESYEWADVIVSVSPSYWADIPGQSEKMRSLRFAVKYRELYETETLHTRQGF